MTDQEKSYAYQNELCDYDKVELDEEGRVIKLWGTIKNDKYIMEYYYTSCSTIELLDKELIIEREFDEKGSLIKTKNNLGDYVSISKYEDGKLICHEFVQLRY